MVRKINRNKGSRNGKLKRGLANMNAAMEAVMVIMINALTVMTRLLRKYNAYPNSWKALMYWAKFKDFGSPYGF